MLTYRHLTTRAEYLQASHLEKNIWQMNPLDVLSPHTQMVMVHTGGCVIGAFDDESLIGYTAAFAMHDTQRLWSHIAAVLPAYQGQGIGYQLKQVQREWAIEQGYTIMHWTFDPMMQANANFNFNRLGVMAETYHVEFYGEMNDDFNQGTPTDRLQVTWYLKGFETPLAATDAEYLLTVADDDTPQLHNRKGAATYFVEIPYDISAIKARNFDLALAWKLTLRGVLTKALAQGYRIVGFTRHDGRCHYVLLR